MKSKDWRPTAFVDTAPSVITEDEADARRVDRGQSLHALLRSISGVAAVALVLVVLLADRAPLPGAAAQRPALAVAVVAFLVGLVSGLAAALALLARGPRVGSPRTALPDHRLGWLVLPVCGLLAGVAALAWSFFRAGMR